MMTTARGIHPNTTPLPSKGLAKAPSLLLEGLDEAFRRFRKALERLRLLFILSFFFISPQGTSAQLNTDRLMISGEIALHYEDYVLSIQYFNQVISQKPYLYQPWQYRAIAKYYLDDFTGSEADCTEALQRNPYVEGLYELRAIDRIRQKRFGRRSS